MIERTHGWMKYTVLLTAAALLAVPLSGSAGASEQVPTLEERLEAMNQESPPGVTYATVVDEETGKRSLEVTRSIGEEAGGPGASASCFDIATGLPEQCSAGPIPIGFIVNCKVTVGYGNHGTFSSECYNAWGSIAVVCNAPTIAIVDFVKGDYDCTFPDSGNLYNGNTVSVEGTATNTPVGYWTAKVSS